MQDITQHVEKFLSEGKEPKSEKKIKADIGQYGLGNGTTLANKAQMDKGDYETVAHLSDAGKITWYGRFKKEAGKNLDDGSYNYIITLQKAKKKAAKKESKAEKKALKMMNANVNFKVKTDDGETRTVVQHNGRIYYYVNGDALHFTHSKKDVVQLIKNGVYEIVESTDIIVGQPIMYANMECTVKSVSESVIELDLDGEVFETSKEDLTTI